MANSRLDELSDERCRDIELAQTKALRPANRGNGMLRELLATMREEPAGPAWKERVHHTLRRTWTALERQGGDADAFRTAINAYLDGQTELAARWLDADAILRPWREK